MEQWLVVLRQWFIVIDSGTLCRSVGYYDVTRCLVMKHWCFKMGQ